jgi:crooked neck
MSELYFDFLENARNVYTQCIDALGQELVDENIYIGFARFETRMKEFERARAIYQYASDSLPPERLRLLPSQFTQFEKQYGARREIEDVITRKRRAQYEHDVTADPTQYDTWVSYIRLEESLVEESGASPEKCRDVYERAIAQVPPIQEKKYWRRYIYLWINYALFEELVTKVWLDIITRFKQCTDWIKILFIPAMYILDKLRYLIDSDENINLIKVFTHPGFDLHLV